MLSSWALFLGASASALTGQTLRITVHDDVSLSPIRGVFVSAIDEAGGRYAAGLTDAAGEVLLRTPAQRTIQVRAEFIGRATVTSARVTLAIGETRALTLPMSAQPIALDGISVAATRRCIVRPGEGAEIAGLWDRVRTALDVASWGRSQELLRFDLERWARELADDGRTVVSEERGRRSARTREPFTARTAEDLHEHGYVQQRPRGNFAYAPDPRVLTSDLFLDHHCFRLADRRGSDGTVGLSFEPVRERTAPDIRGTLWVDGTSGALRSLEFFYTHFPAGLQANDAGGFLEFRQLLTGHWIVSDWWIRLPILAEREQFVAGVPRHGETLDGFHVEGAQVLRVTDAAGRPVGEDALRATLQGRVVDRTTGAPLAGADVRLEGTSAQAYTDEEGRFTMEDLPEGVYGVTFDHLRLDDFLVDHPRQEVTLAPGRVTSVDLGIPPDAAPLKEEVLEEERTFLEGLEGVVPILEVSAEGRVVGRVVEHETGVGIAGAEVVVEAGGVARSPVITDARGRFLLEDLPPGELSISVSHLAFTPRLDSLHLEAGQTADVRLALGRNVIALEGITVEVRSRALEMTGFYDRRIRAIRGRSATRAEFEGVAYRRTVDLLQEVPGLRFYPSGTAGTQFDVRVSRPVFGTSRAGDEMGCYPALYVDGAPRPLDEINSIPLESVEAWEVYIGGTTPVEFSHQCGVILFWSRR